jgi:hypothetical protein
MVFCIVLNIGLSFSIIAPVITYAYFINGSFKKFFLTNNIKLKTLVQRNKPLGALIIVDRFDPVNFQNFQKSFYILE